MGKTPRLLAVWAVPIAAVAAAAGCGELAEVLTPLADGGTELDADREASPPDGSAGTVTLDAGAFHACMTRGGALYCWGENQRGRLGVGDASNRSTPTRVGGAADWVGVTAAEDHSCAIRGDGSLFCFGANDHGQLGVAGVGEALEPALVGLSAVRSVSAEALFSCAVTQQSELYCWGDNFEGQLGQNDTFPGENQNEPVRVETWNDFSVVDAGQGHTCALRSPGTLWCWGRNTASELGFGEGALEQTRAAAQTGSSDTWIDVDAGQHHSCGVQSNGTLSCWGDNQFGNLGTGDYERRMTPTPIGEGNSWQQVSLDTFHSCAVDSAGELWCWGRNVEGQLGLGDNVDRTSPERVSGGGFEFVAVGRFFTCALRVDGTIWCAGANESGQLGVGDSGRRNAMSPIVTPAD